MRRHENCKTNSAKSFCVHHIAFSRLLQSVRFVAMAGRFSLELAARGVTRRIVEEIETKRVIEPFENGKKLLGKIVPGH